MTRPKRKDIPRLPLSAFTAGAADAFPVPPTPSFIAPTAILDAHLHIAHDQATHAVAQQPIIPFLLHAATVPEYPILTTAYDGTTIAEDDPDAKDQLETPVNNLRSALQLARVVDLAIQGSIAATDPAFYDSLNNLLTKAIKDTKRTPIVLTNVLPPPLDSVLPVVMMVNHPTYTTYRQRVSLLSLFDSISLKLLPPPWLPDNPDKDLKNILKLFISPVLEAFGFERIIFGSSPALQAGSPALTETWYNLVLESFRDLAVSQDEMDMIFIQNAKRVYGDQ